LRDNPHPTDDEIREGLSGNLCRCTGYQGILAAMRAAAVAKAQADKERVLAETLSQAAQAEAQRDLQVKQANFLETVQKQKASADKAYEIQTNIMQQQVIAEQVARRKASAIEIVKVKAGQGLP